MITESSVANATTTSSSNTVSACGPNIAKWLFKYGAFIGIAVLLLCVAIPLGLDAQTSNFQVIGGTIGAISSVGNPIYNFLMYHFLFYSNATSFILRMHYTFGG